MADIRKSALARVLFSMHPCPIGGETQCRALGSLEWWPFCRACPQRRCWPRQWSRSRATALSSIPTQTAKIKGQAIPMAIISNPPPKGMIGRAVKPSAWHRSERAPTDPALTAALTRRGTESGPPGTKRGGPKYACEIVPERGARMPSSPGLSPRTPRPSQLPGCDGHFLGTGLF
jgi:hypothetical protein